MILGSRRYPLGPPNPVFDSSVKFSASADVYRDNFIPAASSPVKVEKTYPYAIAGPGQKSAPTTPTMPSVREKGAVRRRSGSS
jgi:hypothetical protein